MKLSRADDPQERRTGRRAGLAGLASVAASLAALVVANSASDGALTQPGARNDRLDEDRLRQLVDFHDSPGAQAAAAALRSVGVLLCIGVGLYLLWLVGRRGAIVGNAVRWTIVAGPVLVVAATLFGFVAFGDVADQFAGSGLRTPARAADLIEHDAMLRVAGAFDMAARVVFAIWIGALSLHAMRAGLLTSFLGYWGVAAAGALIFLPIGDAMFMGWLASIAFLALGYWPGGRPEAWDRAVSADASASGTSAGSAPAH